MSQNNDRVRNVKIKVPPQADGKKTRIVINDPDANVVANNFFRRAIMNFYVQKKEEGGDWELKVNFNPRLELKVGYEDQDNLDWELYYEHPKTGSKLPFAAHNYGYKNRALYHGRPPKHAYVYLDTWGDPNVGWG